MEATLFLLSLKPGFTGFLVLFIISDGFLAYAFLKWVSQTEAALKTLLRTAIIAAMLLGIDLSHPLCMSLITSSICAMLYGYGEAYFKPGLWTRIVGA